MNNRALITGAGRGIGLATAKAFATSGWSVVALVMRANYSGRPGTVEEIEAAILWLGSACPEYVNGTTLDVNNGSYPR